MSTTYSITVLNKRTQAANYNIFSAPPQVQSTNGAVTVYTNVWMSQNIPPGGNYDIKYSQDYYAWVGTVPSTPAPGVVVRTGSSALATLGTSEQPGSTYPMVVSGGGVSLDLARETRTSSPGAFEIDTGTDFQENNSTYLLGMGKVNSFGYVSPVATVLADNNSRYNIAPIVKLYVATSSQQVGTIVNFSQVTNVAGVVDFSSGAGLGKNVAVISHNTDGSFTTTYFNSGGVQKFFAAKAAGRYSFVGRLNWPATTGIGLVSAALVLITSTLAGRGYSCTHSETKNSDGSTTSRVTFGPNTSMLGMITFGDYKQDWAAAVAADTLDDKHVDEGVSSVSEFEAVQFIPKPGENPIGQNNAVTASA